MNDRPSSVSPSDANEQPPAADESGLRLKLPPQVRIRSSADFRRTYDTRASAASRQLIIYARLNHLPFSRMGLSVGRKHGGAVRRNRIKRLLREAFRLTRHQLPVGYDFVVIPRNFGPQVTLDHLLTDFPSVASQAAARADSKTVAAEGKPGDDSAGPSAGAGGESSASGAGGESASGGAGGS